METGPDPPEEASAVEFVIECPVDGPVEVSLEDIDTVVLREPEQADIVFTCPTCGTEIGVSVRVPAFLLSAIESLAEETGGHQGPLAGMLSFTVEVESAEEPEDIAQADAYCEYFRRQLASVASVEDMLHEIDSDD